MKPYGKPNDIYRRGHSLRCGCCRKVGSSKAKISEFAVHHNPEFIEDRQAERKRARRENRQMIDESADI